MPLSQVTTRSRVGAELIELTRLFDVKNLGIQDIYRNVLTNKSELWYHPSCRIMARRRGCFGGHFCFWKLPREESLFLFVVTPRAIPHSVRIDGARGNARNRPQS
jgi:hypothetical protein